MRFMYIVTSSQPMRGPTPALMEAMAKLADREIKAGRMIDSGGLMPVSMGAQVRIPTQAQRGRRAVRRDQGNDRGYAIFELRDKEEAVAAAREFMRCTSITCLAGTAPARFVPLRRRASTVRARSMCARA